MGRKPTVLLWPPLSVRRAAAVLIAWGVSLEMLSAGRDAVVRSDGELFGNGSAALHSAEEIARMAYLAMLLSVDSPIHPLPASHNDKAGSNRLVAAHEPSARRRG